MTPKIIPLSFSFCISIFLQRGGVFCGLAGTCNMYEQHRCGIILDEVPDEWYGFLQRQSPTNAEKSPSPCPDRHRLSYASYTTFTAALDNVDWKSPEAPWCIYILKRLGCAISLVFHMVLFTLAPHKRGIHHRASELI